MLFVSYVSNNYGISRFYSRILLKDNYIYLIINYKSYSSSSSLILLDYSISTKLNINYFDFSEFNFISSCRTIEDSNNIIKDILE
jgi:hypothetical protein